MKDTNQILSKDQSWVSSEGIILKVHPLNENRQIISLFTPNYGIIKLVARHQKTAYGRLAFSYLMKIEAIFRNIDKELWPCQTAIATSSYLHLRDSLEHINWAVFFLRAIHLSQMLHCPSEGLYQLLDQTLLRISDTHNICSLSCHFLIKLLAHEGIFSKALIQEDLSSLSTLDYLPLEQLSVFNEQESKTIRQLVLCRSWSELSTIKIDPSTLDKILALFNESLGHGSLSKPSKY